MKARHMSKDMTRTLETLTSLRRSVIQSIIEIRGFDKVRERNSIWSSVITKDEILVARFCHNKGSSTVGQPCFVFSFVDSVFNIVFHLLYFASVGPLKILIM